MPGIPSKADADANIILRVVNGERDVFIEIVRRYHERLRSILSFYCNSSEEVEEYLQDAFVQAYVNIDRYDTKAPFLPWLKAIALNSLRDEARRREVRTRKNKDYLCYLQLSKLKNDPDGEEAEAKRSALKTCLKKLPSGHSELLTAKYSEERPIAEIARTQGLTDTALKVRLLRIRQAMRDCINKQLKFNEG